MVVTVVELLVVAVVDVELEVLDDDVVLRDVLVEELVLDDDVVLRDVLVEELVLDDDVVLRDVLVEELVLVDEVELLVDDEEVVEELVLVELEVDVLLVVSRQRQSTQASGPQAPTKAPPSESHVSPHASSI